MSLPENIVSAQLQHLLTQLDAQRQARCEGLLAQARKEARQVIRHAHQKSRARVSQAVINIRESTRKRLLSAAAKRQTRERQLRQH